jgi:hypothetical protein
VIDEVWFRHARPEMDRLSAHSARRIVDVGGSDAMPQFPGIPDAGRLKVLKRATRTTALSWSQYRPSAHASVSLPWVVARALQAPGCGDLRGARICGLFDLASVLAVMNQAGFVFAKVLDRPRARLIDTALCDHLTGQAGTGACQAGKAGRRVSRLDRKCRSQEFVTVCQSVNFVFCRNFGTS